VATLLVDSTVHIQWWRGRQSVVEWLASNAAEDLATSVVSVAEIFTGARREAEARWTAYFSRFHVVPIDEHTARTAGGLRFRLARSGRGLSLSDGLIAAQGLLNDWPVATANVKDFVPTGVRLIEVR
jgi:predicted nucleic acid-binding protein